MHHHSGGIEGERLLQMACQGIVYDHLKELQQCTGLECRAHTVPILICQLQLCSMFNSLQSLLHVPSTFDHTWGCKVHNMHHLKGITTPLE